MDNMGTVKVGTNNSTIKEEAGLPESDGTAVEVQTNKGGKFLKKLWCRVGGSITR